MSIELLYFEGCPNVAAAIDVIRESCVRGPDSGAVFSPHAAMGRKPPFWIGSLGHRSLGPNTVSRKSPSLLISIPCT